MPAASMYVLCHVRAQGVRRTVPAFSQLQWVPQNGGQGPPYSPALLGGDATLLNLSAQLVSTGVGLILLAIGLRGKRVGDEPRCRKCLYNLTALTSDACPECGSRLKPGAIVRGVRRLRRIPLVLGFVFLVLNAAASGAFLGGIDLLKHAPFRVVLLVAEMDSLEAVHELFERHTILALSESETFALAEAALEKQEQPATVANGQVWMHLLGLLYFSGELTNEQENRFYERIVPGMRVETRRRIRTGSPFPLAFRTTSRKATTAGLWAGVSGWEIKVEDRVVTSSEALSSLFAPGVFAPSTPVLVAAELNLEPGRYEVELVATVALFPRQRATVKSVWSKRIRFPLEFDVFPSDGDDDLTLVSDPELERGLVHAFYRAGSFFDASVIGTWLLPREPMGWVDIKLNSTVPVGVAFNVVLRRRSEQHAVSTLEEHQLGVVLCPKNSSIAYAILHVDENTLSDLLNESNMEVVFESSPDVARRTLNLYEIWNGILTFRTPDAPIPFRPHPLRTP